MLCSSVVDIFGNIPFLPLFWFTIFFKSLLILSWFLFWTLLVISCTPQSRINKSPSTPEYKSMLIITPLTVDGSPLVNSIFTFSHLSWGNEKLSVMCWLIFCTFNTKNSNLQYSFFMRLFFMTCILQFWKTSSSRNERRIFR